METIMDLLKLTDPTEDFEHSDDFISDGLLDSMDIQVLASNIEDAYHVKLAGTDLMPMNFVNVNTIRDMLKSHGIEGDI